MRQDENGEDNQQDGKADEAQWPVRRRTHGEARRLSMASRSAVITDPRDRDESFAGFPSSSGGTHARDFM